MSLKNSLPFCNFKRRPARSIVLVILSLFLCFAVLAGSLFLSGMRSGLDSLKTRLGADIMVVPYEASTKSELSDMILQGNPGYFYMDDSVVDEVEAIEGVEKVSTQFYLATASSSCCSLSVQIIGFNPETDFTIQPWVSSTYTDELGYMEILVGHDLNAFAGDTLTFYGSDVTVAARLEETGTYLDTSVYANEETIKTLISSALEKQIYDFGDIDPDEIVSCVMVDVADGYTVEDVLNSISLYVDDVEAVQTTQLIATVTDQLEGISQSTRILLVAIWILALIILALAFVMISNERRKEYAVLRAIGASRGKLASIIFKETLLVSAIGAAAGAVLAVVLFKLLNGMIEDMLGLPFLLPDMPGLAIMIAAAIIVAVAAGTIASVACAMRISKTDTALILRRED